MAYDIEGILRQMMTKKEQNANEYNRAMTADSNIFNRAMANRQMANSEKQQRLAQQQQDADNEMDWTDWTKLGVGALSTILGIPTGGGSTVISKLLGIK